ncbi:MAG: hypothetical protein ACXW18_12850 [Pyrinomonadaceae bacterium]
MRFLATSAVVLCFLTVSFSAQAQTSKTVPTDSPNRQDAKQTAADKTKSAKDAEAERVRNERRENARSLLFTLASDAGRFNDSTLRARTLARVADLLWEADRQRARSMFRSAWDAADIAETENVARYRELERQADSTGGLRTNPSPPRVRQEVLRLASKHDRTLGEEFLAKLKPPGERETRAPSPTGTIDPVSLQRIEVACQLLNADQTEQAVQFADPMLGMISMWTVDFLSSLREKDPGAADARYAAMLATAAASPQSDANTVSLLSSYLFSPHSFIMFIAGGTLTRSFQGNFTRPVAAPGLQSAFLRAASNILLRPLAPPGQEQNSAGHDGHYLVIKRLMQLFNQYAPPEMTAALRAQLDALSALVTKATRDRDDDDWVRKDIRPDKFEENWEQSLLDQLDRAKTSAERDKINYQLASMFSGRGELKARDYVDKIDESELRNNVRTYIDMRLGSYAVHKKDADRMLELVRNGQVPHVYKARLLSLTAQLLAKSDNDKAAMLIDLAAAEARRIQASDPDSPSAFLAVAYAMLKVNPAAVWDAMNEAVKASNSAESFSGEGGQLSYSVRMKGMSFGYQENVLDFDLEGIFKTLTDQNYDKVVELAQGFTRQAPRAVATIAIARSVLEDKKK